MIRTALADDQTMVRTALATLLAPAPDIEVIGQTGDCAGAIELARACRPDVLLMDVQMPAGECADGHSGPPDGLAATPEVVALGVGVIVLTAFGRAGYLRRTMEAGASGFMVKDSPAHRLVEGIRRVARGLRVVDPPSPPTANPPPAPFGSRPQWDHEPDRRRDLRHGWHPDRFRALVGRGETGPGCKPWAALAG